MLTKPQVSFGDELPELDPLLLCEDTDAGWRGLTAAGEILAVNGTKAAAGEKLAYAKNGALVGTYTIPAPEPGRIDAYLANYDNACDLFMHNELGEARRAIDAAIAVASTSRARWNRALILLSLGEWKAGLFDFEARHEFIPGPPSEAPRWWGGDLDGKSIVLQHDLGFGDTIMMLRYVPILQQRCRVFLDVPPVLERLAGQLAPVQRPAVGVDYSCPIMSLLHLLEQRPDRLPQDCYLLPDRKLVERWKARLPVTDVPRVGVAWSVGNEVENDYPRAIPLELLVERLRATRPDVEIYSVQAQGGAEAERQGVRAPSFEDFADCAALIALMDEVYSVDTAALHLAGAIGHGNVTGLLSHWHSWRWRAPWYPRMNFAVQDEPGDWPSALANIEP